MHAGTAKVIVTGKGNYTDTANGSFTISPASLSGAKVSVGSQKYTGSQLTPAPTVTLGGKTLKYGTDYTTSYSNNVKVGTVRRFNGDEMEKARTDGAYQISMSFEDGKKDYYALQIPNSLTDGKGEIWISVDSIGYDLCYTANDAALLKELTDTLAALLSN